MAQENKATDGRTMADRIKMVQDSMREYEQRKAADPKFREDEEKKIAEALELLSWENPPE